MLAHTLFEEYIPALLDLLLPPRCIRCKAADSWLCQNCLNKISFIIPPVCARCGTPIPVTPTSGCQQCQRNPLQHIDGIRAAADFDHESLRPVIHFLKYHNHKAVASILGKIVAEAYLRYNLSAQVIVPVPLHSSRFRERGYNQSELIAAQIGKLLHLPLNRDTLQRVRPTQTQMQLGAEERQQNVKNAFACRNTALSGLTVLLIDDVCTTGSTLDACAQALKQSGVVSVWGLTLAKAHKLS